MGYADQDFKKRLVSYGYTPNEVKQLTSWPKYKHLGVLDAIKNMIKRANATAYQIKDVVNTALDFRERHGLKLLSPRPNLSKPIPRSRDRTTTKSNAVSIRSAGRQEQSNTEQEEVTGRYRANNLLKMSGYYTKKIPFPKKRVKMSKSSYAMKGSRAATEDYMTRTTSNGTRVNYTGFCSLVRGLNADNNKVDDQQITLANPLYHVCMSLLRRIVKDYFEHDILFPTSTFANIGISTFPNAASNNPETERIFGIELWYKQSTYTSTGTFHQFSFDHDDVDVFATSTPQSIAHEMAQVLSGSLYGARADPSTGLSCELYGYRIIEAVGTANTERRLGITRLDNQKISITCSHQILIQNTTVSDSNSASTDVIDSNPIKGRVYYFDTPVPKVRRNPIALRDANNVYQDQDIDNSHKLMYDANADGILWPNYDIGTDGRNSAFNQLPTPDVFENCRTYGNISLAPGEIKRFSLHFKFNGYLNKYLSLLHLQSIEGSFNQYMVQQNKINEALGTCVLFAFEKRMSSGDASVSVNYQRNIYCAAKLGKRSITTMLPLTVGERVAVPDNTGEPVT